MTSISHDQNVLPTPARGRAREPTMYYLVVVVALFLYIAAVVWAWNRIGYRPDDFGGEE